MPLHVSDVAALTNPIEMFRLPLISLICLTAAANAQYRTPTVEDELVAIIFLDIEAR